jgi:hypothetical protein
VCGCCCRLTLELRDRQQKVDVLVTKFEMLTSKNRATVPDGGEPKSQAYYIIKVGMARRFCESIRGHCRCQRAEHGCTCIPCS